MKKTAIFTLGWKDAIKGLITSILTTVVTLSVTSINAGKLPTTWIEWKVILIAGLGSGGAYIVKNWLTNSDDKFMKSEPTDKAQ